jgi:hypothetical protein
MDLMERAQSLRATSEAHRLALKHNLERSAVLLAKCYESLGQFVNLRTRPVLHGASVPVKNKPQRKRSKRHVVRPPKLLDRSRTGSRAPPFRATPLAHVHGEEIVSENVLAFPLGGRDQRRPVLVRDVPAALPLDHTPMTDTDRSRHFGEGLPASEEVLERSKIGGGSGFHNPLIEGDGLSRQAVSIVPVTRLRRVGTISHMGRARTPVQFNKELALRLKSARVAAGYGTQGPFAKALGIELERYKKWESGRTPIQHEFIPAACELTGKDANYFYGVPARELVVKRTGS